MQRIQEKDKEDMFGIYAWNAVTSPDRGARQPSISILVALLRGLCQGSGCRPPAAISPPLPPSPWRIVGPRSSRMRAHTPGSVFGFSLCRFGFRLGVSVDGGGGLDGVWTLGGEASALVRHRLLAECQKSDGGRRAEISPTLVGEHMYMPSVLGKQPSRVRLSGAWVHEFTDNLALEAM